MKGRPTRLGDILAGSKLADLASRARDAESLFHQIKDLLPNPEAAHVTGASRSGDTVVILADSAAWATRIRFHAPELLKWLSPKYDGAVERVKVRVRPEAGARPPG
ncbi:MAG: DciA family protein [Gammaproteobacteria bacterium]